MFINTKSAYCFTTIRISISCPVVCPSYRLTKYPQLAVPFRLSSFFSHYKLTCNFFDGKACIALFFAPCILGFLRNSSFFLRIIILCQGVGHTTEVNKCCRVLNWWKGKPSGNIACTRKQQPRFYWSCSSVVMNDATPPTPPCAWVELHFQM